VTHSLTVCALQGLSKAAAALKTESKIDAKTPRSGGSLAEALKLSGAKRGREGEANGHAAKKGPAAAADSSSDDDDTSLTTTRRGDTETARAEAPSTNF